MQVVFCDDILIYRFKPEKPNMTPMSALKTAQEPASTAAYSPAPEGEAAYLGLLRYVLENGIKPGRAAQHRIFTTDDGGFGQGGLRDQGGG